MLDEERYQANLKGLLPFIYIIPSYIAHIVVLVAIMSRRNKEELGTNFFRLYSFSAITAILSSFFLFIYSRARYTPCLLPFFQIMPDRSWYGTLLYIGAFYFIYAELFVSFMLNINRASVVLLKTRYQKFWKTYQTPCLIFLFLLSGLFVVQMCFTDVSMKLINPNDPEKGYDWKERSSIPWIQNSVVMLSIVLVTAVGSVAANLYVLIYLITTANNPKSFDESQKGNKDAQKRLFIFTAIMLVNHLAFAIMQIMFTVVKDSSVVYFLISIQAYVLDFINLSPPWCLLFVSPQMRRCVLRMKVIREVSIVVKISQGSQIPSSHAGVGAARPSIFATTPAKQGVHRTGHH